MMHQYVTGFLPDIKLAMSQVNLGKHWLSTGFLITKVSVKWSAQISSGHFLVNFILSIIIRLLSFSWHTDSPDGTNLSHIFRMGPLGRGNPG